MKRQVFRVAGLLLFLVAFGVAAEAQKPRIAVLPFEAKADQQWYSWWRNGGATAAQDVFVTQLVKSGKFTVIDREKLDDVMREQDLSSGGRISQSTAVKMGKLMGVKYFITGAVTEYGSKEAGGSTGRIGRLPGISAGKKTFVAAINARIIDTETGEILWADDVRKTAKTGKLRVGRFGGGTSDDAMFDRVLKPAVEELTDSIKANF